jgi:hypothetical protein
MKIRKSASSHGNMTTATGTATSSPSSAVASNTNSSLGATGGPGNASADEKPSTSATNRRGSSGAASHVLSGFGILKKKSISG